MMDEIELIKGLRRGLPASAVGQRERARAELMAAIEAESTSRRGASPSRFRLSGRRAAVIAAVVALIPAGLAVADRLDSGSDITGPHTAPGSARPGPPEPTLSADQENRALELVAADPTAQQVLEGKDYEVSRMGPWGGERGDPLIGAAMMLRFSQPESFPMRAWPFIDYRPGEDPPYRKATWEFGASNVTDMEVMVDLRRERVVSIDPSGGEAQITPGPELRGELKDARTRGLASGD